MAIKFFFFSTECSRVYLSATSWKRLEHEPWNSIFFFFCTLMSFTCVPFFKVTKCILNALPKSSKKFQIEPFAVRKAVKDSAQKELLLKR